MYIDIQSQMYSLEKFVGGAATKFPKKLKFGFVCGAWPDPISRAQTLMKFADCITSMRWMKQGLWTNFSLQKKWQEILKYILYNVWLMSLYPTNPTH